MKTTKLSATLGVVFALLSALIPSVIVAQAPKLTEFESHVVAACNVPPNQVEIRIQNRMTETVKVTGELWAQPTGGQAVLIASVPPADQQILPGAWGGPLERIANRFPEGFVGVVWGWAKMHRLDDSLIGQVELASTPMNCGPNQEAKLPVNLDAHTLAVCDIPPNEVEIRVQNRMTETVKVTGELWAQPAGGEALLISSVPVSAQLVEPGAWSGPEERIVNRFPNGFTGVVWGWAEVHNLEDQLLARFELAKVKLECSGGPGRKIFLPIVFKPKPVICQDLAMWVFPPNAPATAKPFGESPGPVYAFGDALVAGQTVSFRTNDNQPVNQSYLGWYNFYTRETGVGPEWSLRATGFEGNPPLLGILYTWQATKTLPDGTRCAIGFLLQWDPPE